MPRSSVVLPAPFGPSSATNSPRSIAKRDVLEDRAALVAEADVAQRDERFGHQPPCTAFSIVRTL